MKRRISSIVSTLLAVVLLGGMALLVPAGASTEPGIAQEQPVPDLDPAALDLGNSDAGAMMALINRAISLHD